MKADRTLLGVILIALILSTLVTIFIVGEKSGPYSIVKNDHPQRAVLTHGRRYSFGLTLMAREPVASLRISYFCLVNRTDLIEGIRGQATPDDVFQRISGTRSYLDMSKGGLLAPETHTLEIEIPVRNGEKIEKKKFDLYLFDFSKLVWQAVPQETMHSLDRPLIGFSGTQHLWDYYNIFAALFDEGGDLTYFYQGVADFFCNKVIAIEELIIQRNEDKSIYHGVTKEGEPQDEVISVLDAPDMGIVCYENIWRNDRITVFYSLDSSWVPSNQGIIQIIKIDVDEGSPEYIANVM